MFDIYGIVDFRKRQDFSRIGNPFCNHEYYRQVLCKVHRVQLQAAQVFCLEREEITDDYYFADSVHTFIYGFVFSSKKYQSLTRAKLRKFTAEEVFFAFKKYGRSIVDYVRGSFVLIFYDERTNSLLFISDHLNVLPIYYAYKNGVFIFSSAIKPILDSGFVGLTIDRTAILEFAVLDCTLGGKTYYEEVSLLDYGRFLEVNSCGVCEDRFFTVSNLFNKRLLEEEESFEMLRTLLRENVNLYASDTKQFLLSLTGGFDGRVNLAMLDRPKDDFLCFSYGMPGSRQISVPRKIANRMGIHYKPIPLDGKYEDAFEDCAMEAVFFSDGTAPILRANYPYVYQQLRDFSTVAITGLFGSEVLRPIRNLGVGLNDNVERLFLSKDFDKELRQILDHERQRHYFRSSLFYACYDEFRDHIYEHYFKPYKEGDGLFRLFIYFMEEGIRKYFMQEIRIERVYVTTRFPYLDYDLLCLLFRTPYAGLYNGALRRNPLARRKAQSLYARIMHELVPELGQILVDRGYRPNDLLSPLWFLKILPGYLRTKMYYRHRGNDTFDAERWTDIVFSKNTELMRKETDLFPGKMSGKYANGENLVDNYYFSRVFSLKYWFEKC